MASVLLPGEVAPPCVSSYPPRRQASWPRISSLSTPCDCNDSPYSSSWSSTAKGSGSPGRMLIPARRRSPNRRGASPVISPTRTSSPSSWSTIVAPSAPASFDRVFRAEGTQILKTRYRTPNASVLAERFVRNVRSECFGYLLITNETHLEGGRRSCVCHRNSCRPTRGCLKNPGMGVNRSVPGGAHLRRPAPASPAPSSADTRHDRLGGLIHEKQRALRCGLSFRTLRVGGRGIATPSHVTDIAWSIRCNPSLSHPHRYSDKSAPTL
jgi:hypothetical protein